MANPLAGSPIGVGTVLSGTYQITGLLGRGGMGTVFAAAHLRLPGKVVAVKVIHTGNLGDEVYVRFRREAEIASRIGHPNIVEVLDWNTLPDGTPYLVLELLKGESLAARLTRGRIPLDAVIYIVRQIGSALAAAHRAGVVHRDLKPDNIYLCPTDSGGVVTEHVKVLDFGISKIRNSVSLQTQEARLLGTPQYMAPEQASGNNQLIDQRTDVFALGAIVYEMLTGKPAFDGDSLAAVVYKVAFETPPPLGKLVPGIPAKVTAAIDKAMAKDRDKRHPDIATFVAELSGRPVDVLDRQANQPGGPVNAFGSTANGTPPVMIRTTGTARKGRGALWAVLGLIVVGGGGVAIWQATSGSAGVSSASQPVATAPSSAPSVGVNAPNPPGAPTPTTPPIAQVNPPPASAPAAPPPPSPPASQPVAVAPASAPSSVPVATNPPAPPTAPAAPTPPTPSPKPAPPSAPAKPKPPAEPEEPNLPDLIEAEAAMQRHDFQDAIRLARHSLQVKKTQHAFGIMTRAYCGLKDLSNANANLQTLPAQMRANVLKTCRNMGFPLDG